MVKRQARKELLEKAGLWQTFVSVRESLKRNGLGVTEASEKAWLTVQPDIELSLRAIEGVPAEYLTPEAHAPAVAPATAEFPARAELQRAGDVSARAEVQRAEMQKPLDLRRDIEWAYKTFGVEGLTMHDAPTPGAWALRQWGMLNRETFFANIVTKILPSRSQLEKQDAQRGTGRSLSIIEEIRREAADAVRRAGAQGVPCESELPRSDDPSGQPRS